MKIKTSELIDDALDWAVAKCEGYDMTMAATCGDRHGIFFLDRDDCLRYTTNWKQGGPIIEREGIRWNKETSDYREIYYTWVGGHEYYDPLHIPMQEATENLPNPNGFEYGKTLLIAAMRCYVASKLGDTVDVPEELL